MRRLIILGVFVAGGVAAWQVGNRLSTDSVAMAVGLVFGTLALLPATVLVLATSGHTRSADGDAWENGYQAGIRDVTALALAFGTRQQLEQYDGRTIDGAIVPHRYSVARPFDVEAMR